MESKFFCHSICLIRFIALDKLRIYSDIDKELNEIKADEENIHVTKTTNWSIWKMLHTKELLLPLLLSCSANFTQGITGLDEILLYVGERLKPWEIGNLFNHWALLVLCIIGPLVSALAVCYTQLHWASHFSWRIYKILSS